MVTIDGKNIKEEYGCTLLWGSFDSIFCYPRRVQPEYNNWAESDGIDPDLSEVKFEPRKMKLIFIQESGDVRAFREAYNKLYSDMTAPGYRALSVIGGITTNIRLDTSSAYKTLFPFRGETHFTSFTLDFIEDNPAIESSDGPSGNNAPLGLYQINGVDFGKFGIGADEREDDILKYVSLKEPFTNGRTVYTDNIRTTHKNIILRLWMKAGSVLEFINNYRAFFSQFNKPGIQHFYFDSAGLTIGVYYSNCDSFNIMRWEKRCVLAKFTITLVVPRVEWVDKEGVRRHRVLRDNGTNAVLSNEESKIMTFI
jgi:hypothetical protein